MAGLARCGGEQPLRAWGQPAGMAAGRGRQRTESSFKRGIGKGGGEEEGRG